MADFNKLKETISKVSIITGRKEEEVVLETVEETTTETTTITDEQ